MTKELELMDGCLGEGATNNDYLLTDGIADGLPTLYEQDLVRFYYNQRKNDWSKKSCTIFGAVGAVSDLMNYKYSLSEIKAPNDLSYTKGRVQGKGRTVFEAVKLICNERNKDHTEKVAYYKIDMKNDALVKKVLEKNYDIVTGFYANGNRTLDKTKDGVLDGKGYLPSTFGHCICLVGLGGEVYVKDNYDGEEYNVYKLAHMPSEIEGWHNCGYVITKVAQDKLEEVKRLNELSVQVNIAMEANSKMWHLVNDENFKAILHYQNEKLRNKMKDIEIELNKCK